jgi:polyhydroxyalkanoate synthesis regulator phasin
MAERDKMTPLEQIGGVLYGFGSAGWEATKGLVSLGIGVGKTGLDYTVGLPISGGVAIAEVIRGDTVEIPDILPSLGRGNERMSHLAQTAPIVWNNPSLVWEGIKDPYVKAWAEGRYEEAIGRGFFDVAGIFVGTKQLDQLAKFAKVGDISQLADLLKLAKLTGPESFAKMVGKLIESSRAADNLSALIKAAKQNGTLEQLLDLGKLSKKEIEELVEEGVLTPQEAKRALEKLERNDGVKVTKEGGEGEKGDVDEVPNNARLGARGTVSGRDFDPELAGGPIRELTTENIRFTNKAVDIVEKHTSRFGPDAANEYMIDRLRRIANGEIEATQVDRNFYTHELREFVRYRRQGWEIGAPKNNDLAHDLWNNAHTATLEEYRILGRLEDLYHPDAIKLMGDI